MVLVEATVLRGDYSVLEIRRDLAERNEFVVFTIRLALNPGLNAALYVNYSRWRVNPPSCNEDQHRSGLHTEDKRQYANDDSSNMSSNQTRPKRMCRCGQYFGSVGYLGHVSR